MATRVGSVVTGGNAVPKAPNVNKQAGSRPTVIVTRAVMPPKQLNSQYAGLPASRKSA